MPDGVVMRNEENRWPQGVSSNNFNCACNGVHRSLEVKSEGEGEMENIRLFCAPPKESEDSPFSHSNHHHQYTHFYIHRT
jgi:hypothetical protein